MYNPFSRLALMAAALLVLAVNASAALSIADAGRVTFTSPGSTAAELSGITWAGGNTYYAVNDGQRALYTLDIQINSLTGGITGTPTVVSEITLAQSPTPFASDREGIAYDWQSGTVWVADEGSSESANLRRHDIVTGAVLQGPINAASHAALNVYSNIRTNKGWESLSRQANGQTTWLANEEALSVDGPIASTSQGTIVRLQRFDSAMNPNGQFAYVTQPIQGTDPTIAGAARRGVSDLTVLPDGTVLVLEREFSDTLPRFRIAIYQIDLAGATDVSGVASLDGGGFTAVSKNLLFSKSYAVGSAIDNFEGMTLGPALDLPNTYSLLLIADNGSGTTHALQALTITGIPEPSTIAVMLGTGALLLRKR